MRRSTSASNLFVSLIHTFFRPPPSFFSHVSQRSVNLSRYQIDDGRLVLTRVSITRNLIICDLSNNKTKTKKKQIISWVFLTVSPFAQRSGDYYLKERNQTKHVSIMIIRFFRSSYPVCCCKLCIITLNMPMCTLSLEYRFHKHSLPFSFCRCVRFLNFLFSEYTTEMLLQAVCALAKRIPLDKTKQNNNNKKNVKQTQRRYRCLKERALTKCFAFMFHQVFFFTLSVSF